MTEQEGQQLERAVGRLEGAVKTLESVQARMEINCTDHWKQTHETAATVAMLKSGGNPGNPGNPANGQREAWKFLNRALDLTFKIAVAAMIGYFALKYGIKF